MEQSSNTKPVRTILIAILIIGVIYFLFSDRISLKNKNKSEISSNTAEASMVMVENTIAKNGVLSPPKGFPQDIPFEDAEIVESAVTNHPQNKIRQFSLNYLSVNTPAQKYREYVEFMDQNNFAIIQEGTNSKQRFVSGIKGNTALIISISNDKQNKTLVQISYIEPVSM